jgi:glutamate-1-semialdehyde 2,1-aminomutase
MLDEVRAGMRLDASGSWETLGVRPDLSAWSKYLANGYPLSAITGAEWLRDAASRIYTTGSFWYGAVAMAAAVATLRVVRRDNLPAHLARIGQLLRDGLDAGARRHGLVLRQTGPVQMPLVLFADDPGAAKGEVFCAAALRHGAYFHPRHNMFLCAAHTEADVAEALEAAEHGFAAVAAL